MKILRWTLIFPYLTTMLLASAAQQVGAAQVGLDGEAGGASLANGSSFSSEGLDLQLLTRRAGLIFLGTVHAVELQTAKEPVTSSSESAVKITFHVDEGIRGAITGQEIAIREWRGLWNRSHGARYKTGDRVLIFYHEPGPLGLTSPVSGEAGRFALGAQNRVQLTTEQKHVLLRSSRLHTNLSADQIATGRISYEQIAKIVRQASSEK